MHVMMVDILLQVLAATLRATRGEYPQSGPNIGGNRLEVKASKANSLKLRNQHQWVLLAQKDQGIGKFCCTTQSRDTEQHGIHHAWRSKWEKYIQFHRSQTVDPWDKING